MVSSAQKKRYIEALQTAILQYCEVAVKENPNVFTYKSIDLRPSIEKKLYFRYIDNTIKLKTYIETSEIEIDKDPVFSDMLIYAKHALRVVKRLLSATRSTFQGVTCSDHLAITCSAKHHDFLTKILPNVVHMPNDELQRNLKHAMPKISLASNELALKHYDLLVLCEAFFHILSINPPQLIILVEGNTYVDCIISSVAKKLGIKTLCIQYGWAFTVHLGFQRMMHDYFLSWGEAFSEVLKPFNPSTKFQNIGHLYLDQPKELALIKDPMQISVILQAPMRWIGDDTFNEFINSCVFLAQNGYRLKVREHPSWKLNLEHQKILMKEKNIEMINPREVPLELQLSSSTFSMTIFSSVGFESMLSNTIAVFYQPGLALNMVPQITNEKICFQVNTPKDLLECLNGFTSNKDLLIDIHQEMGAAIPRFFEATGATSKSNLMNFMKLLES